MSNHSQELSVIKNTLDAYQKVFQKEEGKYSALATNLKERFGVRNLSSAETLLKEEIKSRDKLNKKADRLIAELNDNLSNLEEENEDEEDD